MKKSTKKQPAKREEKCYCPYCEVELILEAAPFCSACQVTIVRCTSCLTVLKDKDAKTCHKCGATLE